MLFIGNVFFLPGAASLQSNAGNAHPAWPLLVLRWSQLPRCGLYVHLCWGNQRQKCWLMQEVEGMRHLPSVITTTTTTTTILLQTFHSHVLFPCHTSLPPQTKLGDPCLSVCLFICLSVHKISQKVINGLQWKFRKRCAWDRAGHFHAHTSLITLGWKKVLLQAMIKRPLILLV